MSFARAAGYERSRSRWLEARGLRLEAKALV